MSDPRGTDDRGTGTRGVSRRRSGSPRPGQAGGPIGPPPPPGWTPEPPAAQVGSLIHRLVLYALFVRLSAVGVPCDLEIRVSKASKKLSSERAGSVDFAIFIPDPKQPGSDIADLYELKPDNPDRFEEYVSEVDHYTDYFPRAYRPRRIRAAWRRPVSRARLGQVLSPMYRAVPVIFDPIVIDGPGFTLFIRFWPARKPNGTSVDGLIVYEWGVRQKRPEANERAMEVREQDILRRLKVDPEVLFRINRRNISLTPGVAATAAGCVVLIAAGIYIWVPVTAAGVLAATATVTTASGVSLETVAISGTVANDVMRIAAGIALLIGGARGAQRSDQ